MLLQRVALCSVVLMALLCCQESDEPAVGFDLATNVRTLAVADEPVTIGSAKGEEPYLLSGVADATRQSDGTIVVADCHSSELRYFDRSGSHVRTVGGPGEGPGEFGFIRRLFPLGADTLVVAELFQLTVIAPGGVLIRTIPLSLPGPTVPGRTEVLGRTSDGSFIARRSGSSASKVEGYIRNMVAILRIDPAGVPMDSITGLPGGDPFPPATPDQPMRAVHLPRTGVAAVHPERIYYGGQDKRGIIEFDSTLAEVGRTSTITRAEPVTAEVIEAYRAAAAEGGHDGPPGSMAWFPPTGGTFPPELPAYGDLIAGRDGRLWVQDPLRPGHYPLVWTAYEDGEPVARAEVPPRFFPFEFGRDWVLGVSFDELSIERIQLWHLVPGELAGRVLPPRDAQPPHVARCGILWSR